MRAVAIGLMLVFLSISPANARHASVQDRMEMAVTIATDIHFDQKLRLSNPFKTNAVELGPTAIERSAQFGELALADWHSAEGRVHGQVLLVPMCGWRVHAVSVGRRLKARDLNVRPDLLPATVKVFSKLSAEVVELETQHVAYLKPALPITGC
jgi:hypothetical protein